MATFSGTSAADSLVGGTTNDTLIGYDGNDTLDGGLGVDALIGGAGDDVYYVDVTGDQITENANEGTDTMFAATALLTMPNFTLAANVENLTLIGTNALNGIGNSLNNILTGNSLANVLTGGLGNDTYFVQNSDDSVIETSTLATEIDQVFSSATFTLTSSATANDYVENLTLTGTDAIDGTGNALNNILTGNSGVNALTGGLGNDTYFVQTTGDTVIEGSSLAAEIDTVNSSVNFTLDAAGYVENLILTGTADLNGSGNTLANTLTGNSGANSLDGGAGNDNLIGGLGNDTYVVDSSLDVITENAGEGTDTVKTSVDNYTLISGLENLTLTGSATQGTGNADANVLTSNTAAISNLTGGAGDDTYVIYNSADQINENTNAGTDTVKANGSYSLSSNNLENLTLLGSTGTESLDGAGNTKDNVLTGNSGSNDLTGGVGNDTLIGGDGNDGLDYTSAFNVNNSYFGADSMQGGKGDDHYAVDNTGDIVSEVADQGYDYVNSLIDYTLPSDTEELWLYGDATVGVGNGLDNVLYGTIDFISMTTDIANTLDGGLGADNMYGEDGSDTYIVDNTGDSVYEYNSDSVTGGVDEIQSSVTYGLNSNIENLTLTGSASIKGFGNNLDNIITGNSAQNTLTGGTGEDTYVVQNTGDVVVETHDTHLNSASSTVDDIDTIESSVTYALSTNATTGFVENLTLTGTDAINGTGNTLDNIITGNEATNTLTGGLGNDTYFVQNSTDVVVETSTGGTDNVQSSASFTLGANVENLTLTGTDDISGTGNTSVNTLTGNDGANTLDGGVGADNMAGGAGDDTYVVDSAADSISETAGTVDTGGIDTVVSSMSYTLSDTHLENLTLTGTAVINGTGNTLANIITGNDSTGILDGGLGNDTYIINNAGTTVREDSFLSTEIDQVNASISYTLAVTNVENLTLTGTDAIDGTGNTLANTITGNDANNVLDGGVGSDNLIGGKGDDTYVIDYINDKVTEKAGEGTDTVDSIISYTLGANLENLTLLGDATASGTNAVGNSQDNILTGNAANNTLNGLVGNDTAAGGLGDDTYVVDSTGDLVTENNDEGIDTVQTNVNYTLSNYVENLTLNGTVAQGTGNAQANTLTGNGAANTLNGLGGIDTLVGGKGNDAYVVDNSADVVTETSTLSDEIDSVTSSASYALGDNVENLTLTGTASINATGNTLNNVLTGNSGANVLDGGVGADTLTGGAGNDTYVVNAGDVVNEAAAAGTDTVKSSINYTLKANFENLTLTGSAVNAYGNAVNNVLTGNAAANKFLGGAGIDTLNGDAGNDTLDGGVGADKLNGGAGNDVYIVDVSGDVITEGASQGIDLVQSLVTYTLANNVDNLTLTSTTTVAVNGTGNSLANSLTGNAAANILTGNDGNDTLTGNVGNDTLLGGANNDTLTGGAGNDKLDGGIAVDKMVGGAGNDSYVVDNLNDVVVEAAGEGIDIVSSAINYTLKANVENLTLTGFAANGTGNGLNNTLTGNSLANVLNGGLGADKLDGQAGNDNLIGGDAIDTLLGGAGNDTLDGGAGADVLTGGAGADIFKLATLGSVDKLTDFVPADDTIQLENAVFAKLGGYTGPLKAASFQVGAAAAADDYVLYNTTTGVLSYDADGNGAGAAVQIAVVGSTTHPVLTAADFVVI